MKILLINPPQTYNRGETPFVVFPLGLGYISAVLRKHGFDIHVLDCVGEAPARRTSCGKENYLLGLTLGQTKEAFEKMNPDVVLVSCLVSSQYPIVRDIVAMLKVSHRDVTVVLGGNHATAQSEIFLNEGNVDYVVAGEAERPLLKLMESLSKNQVDIPIRSISCTTAGSLVLARELDLVENLDTLPFPAWDLFPMQNYLGSKHKHTMLPSRGAVAEVITSRGCPFGCTYCASHVVSGRTFRARSVSNVIAEINTLKNRYCIEEVHFEDDNLALDKARFTLLCKELAGLGIRWTAPNGMSIAGLDESLVRLMKNSGCYAIFLAIESTHPKVLKDEVKKQIILDHVRSVAKYARNAGLYMVGFFVVGFSEETGEDIRRTSEFATELGLDEAHFSILTPLPGTQYYAEHTTPASASAELSSKNANLDTLYLTKRGIESLRNRAYLVFEARKFLAQPWSYVSSSQIRRLMRYFRYFALAKSS
jgi:anaerobic magnesium-protoporphyrin IX monomethyl ester cyclase